MAKKTQGYLRKKKRKLSSRYIVLRLSGGGGRDTLSYGIEICRLLAMINYHLIYSLTASHGTKSETVSETRTDKNWVFKINCFGQEMKAYHTSPHKLFFSTAPENPVTHLATKRWQRESFVVECCFDYFNRKIVIGLVSPYGSHTWQRRDDSAKVLLLNAVLTISTGKLLLAWSYHR